MEVLAHRPVGYDLGAYRLVIRLSEDEERIVRDAPRIAFRLPKLPKRSVIADSGFNVAAVLAGEVELMGVLQLGAGWLGHCYTNGVEERANPTPIGAVTSALQQNAEQAIATMRAWLRIAQTGADDPDPSGS